MAHKTLYPTVLCYHGCTNVRRDTLPFREHIEDIKAHIKALMEEGYEIIWPSEYEKWQTDPVYRAAHPYVAQVQFDDGLDTVSLIAEWLNINNIKWSWALITRRQRRIDPELDFAPWSYIKEQLGRGRMELMSHTHNLHHLTLHQGDDGLIMSAPILEGPCWIDSGDVVYMEAGDNRMFWDYSIIDTGSLGLPLFGVDQWDGTQLVKTTIKITPKISGSCHALRLLMGLSFPSGSGYDCDVSIRANGVQVFRGLFKPVNYETRTQWVEREFFWVDLDTPFNVTAGSTFELTFETHNFGNGLAALYALPTHDEAHFSAVTNCRSFFPAGSQEGEYRFWKYIDYPPNEPWPVRAGMILCIGQGAKATVQQYRNYVSEDCQNFKDALSNWLYSTWSQNTVAFPTSVNFPISDPNSVNWPESGNMVTGWQPPNRLFGTTLMTIETDFPQQTISWVRFAFGPAESFPGGDAEVGGMSNEEILAAAERSFVGIFKLMASTNTTNPVWTQVGTAAVWDIARDKAIDVDGLNLTGVLTSSGRYRSQFLLRLGPLNRGPLGGERIRWQVGRITVGIRSPGGIAQQQKNRLVDSRFDEMLKDWEETASSGGELPWDPIQYAGVSYPGSNILRLKSNGSPVFSYRYISSPLNDVLPGSQWTFSVEISRKSSAFLSIIAVNSFGVKLSESSTVVPQDPSSDVNVRQRSSVSITTPAGTVKIIARITLNKYANQQAEFTFTAPQLEAGLVATSYSPTNTIGYKAENYIRNMDLIFNDSAWDVNPTNGQWARPTFESLPAVIYKAVRLKSLPGVNITNLSYDFDQTIPGVPAGQYIYSVYTLVVTGRATIIARLYNGTSLLNTYTSFTDLHPLEDTVHGYKRLYTKFTIGANVTSVKVTLRVSGSGSAEANSSFLLPLLENVDAATNYPSSAERSNYVTKVPPTHIIYPFGAYLGDEGVSVYRPHYTDIGSDLRDVFTMHGLTRGYTIQALRNKYDDEATVPALRLTDFSVGRWLLYGNQDPKDSLDHLALYSGYKFHDVVHNNIKWIIDIKEDPLGSEAVKQRINIVDVVSMRAGEIHLDNDDRYLIDFPRNDGKLYETIQYPDDKGWLQARGIPVLYEATNCTDAAPLGDINLAYDFVYYPEIWAEILVNKCLEEGFNGVTLKIAAIQVSTDITHQDIANAFAEVARALHAQNLIIHVQVPSISGLPQYDAPYLKAWCQYWEIVKYVDVMRVPMWEASNVTPGSDGPHSPDNYWNGVINHILSTVPIEYRKRVYLGGHTFGTFWDASGGDDMDYHSAINSMLGFAMSLTQQGGEVGGTTRGNPLWMSTPLQITRCTTNVKTLGLGGISLTWGDDADLSEFYPNKRVIDEIAIMSYLGFRFPPEISYGSGGGPVFKTNVTKTQSGDEFRDSLWETPLYKFDVSHNIQSQDEWEKVRDIFLLSKGKWGSFRFKDWSDFKANNTFIATGDGTRLNFQLIKTYQIGSISMRRKITKPINGTLTIMVQGQLVTGWTCDWNTGIVSFAAPPSGTITATYDFDCHCRFDMDHFPSDIIAWGQKGAYLKTSSITLAEVRE